MHVRVAERGRKLMDGRHVAVEAALIADHEQPRARIEESVIRMEEPDEIVDLLVRNNPSNKQDVRPLVVELVRNEPVRFTVKMYEVRHDRQYVRARKAKRDQLVPVELGVAQRE